MSPTGPLMPETIGKYRLLESIGRGGMGLIFKAHDPVLDRQVALKIISPDVEVTDELRARFFREAKACARLNHPNIVTVYDMGEDAGRLFIVMELLEGRDLRHVIRGQAALSLERKLSVMRQVCQGLHYAHQNGVVHRDMKPGNIFLLDNGGVKILDFGIAHMATNQAELTKTGLVMGTLRYVAPEQLRGRADERSDMFSVGAVFYELLTSRPPFQGEDPMQLLEQLRTVDPPLPTEIDPSVPPAASAIVGRAMQKDPTRRFRDLEEMGAEIQTVDLHPRRPDGPPSPEAIVEIPRPSSSPIRWTIAAAVVVALAGGAGLAYWRSTPAPAPREGTMVTTESPPPASRPAPEKAPDKPAGDTTAAERAAAEKAAAEKAAIARIAAEKAASEKAAAVKIAAEKAAAQKATAEKAAADRTAAKAAAEKAAAERAPADKVAAESAAAQKAAAEKAAADKVAAEKIAADRLAAERAAAEKAAEKAAAEKAAAERAAAEKAAAERAAAEKAAASKGGTDVAVAVPPSQSLGRFGSDGRGAIQQVLDEFRRAYETKDLASIQRLRPTLPAAELRTLRSTFDNAATYSLDLKVETLEVRGNEAQARVLRQDVMVAKDGQIYRSQTKVTIRLQRTQDRWTIDDIR